MASSLSSVTLNEEDYVPPMPMNRPRAPLHRAIDRMSRFFGTPDWVRPPFQHGRFIRMPESAVEQTEIPQAFVSAKHKTVFAK
jgi:hypothetical protein